MKRVIPKICLITGIGLLLLTATTNGQPFKNGERVCFVGNSITNNGMFYNLVELYYATRYPDVKVDFLNCGLSGDVTGGILRRLNNDVLYLRPHWVVLMAGMNDVGRGSYSPARQQEPGIQVRRKEALETYYRNMALLLRRLDSAKCRVILQTPTIYDQRTVSATENLVGVNGALKACADFVRTTATAHGLPVIDYWSFLNQLNETLTPQAGHTLINADRVHPSAEGHMAMAYQFLKSGHGTAYVSRINIKGNLGQTNRGSLAAKVTGLKRSATGLTFSCLEQALPFPVPPEVLPALAWMPFTREFNQELLQIGDLADGNYELFIDGASAGRFSAAGLAKGVNLADNTATPQYKQAVQVMKLCQKKREADLAIRNIRNFQVFHLPDSLWNAGRESKSAFMQHRIAQQNDTLRQRNYAVQFERYLSYKPDEAALMKRRQSLADSIHLVNKPVAHTFLLKKTK